MKQVRGFWLPDNETHLIPFLEKGPEFAGGPTYQLHKFQAAVPFIKNFRQGVDIGAHCGLWTRVMAACFASVMAFEPVPEHRACLASNLKWFELQNVTMAPVALGDRSETVSLHTGPASSGDTGIQSGGEHTAEMRTLDSFNLTDVDFIKIDTEGYEYFVLRGGEATIRRDKPCIIVEQKPDKGRQYGIDDHAAVTLLRSWGAEQVGVISGDYIMAWR